ncbi:N-6 DNA methylase [Streptomyces sp. NPDC005279]|uniref:N-6 DNA methylase n=1 Tax=Streptomyces sp. NPDC005279 TaxID=3364712 RepID=UPI0036896B2F
MARLTLAQLERHLWAAADILRGTVDAAEYGDFLAALLYLKRANDEPGGQLPERARWERLSDSEFGGPGEQLHRALAALGHRPGYEQLRDLYLHVRFSAVEDRRLGDLIDHFGRIRLRNEDLAYSGMLGDAYEHLLQQFAYAAGRKGGEFYTPRAVVRLMTELAQPRPGMRVYDPCVGTGGMLVAAAKYVEDHGGDTRDLMLAGQDTNPSAWSSAAANMLMHGVERFRLDPTDSLTLPIDADGGFDLVLSNPPFAVDYRRDEVPRVEERMPYGWTSERGKADLMFLQHMLDMARGRNGSVVSVLPRGVLFRGGQEQLIRSRLLDADLIEAVIGLGPNLFHGTGIPTCLIVLPAAGQRDPERQGTVLFINAEREYRKGQAQNVLLPEHVQKIASTFHSRQEIPGFSRIVPREVLEENADNLAIHRYVLGEPQAEQQDLQAHLKGGIPVDEITPKLPLLAAYGLEPGDLFLARAGSPGYMDFRPQGKRPDAASLTTVARVREQELWAAYEEGWQVAARRITAHLPHDDEPRATRPLASLREELTEALREPMLAVALLDPHGLGGTVAGWWQDSESTLRSLAANGFTAVVDGWCDDVEALLGRTDHPRRGSQPNSAAYRHPVVAALLPDFLEKLAEERAAQDDLDVQYKELGPEDTDSDSGATAGAKAMRRDFKKARQEVGKRIRNLEAAFSLTRARSELDADGLRAVVLAVLRRDLAGRLEEQLASNCAELVRTYENWEVKYGLSFQEIEDRLPGAAETSRTLRQTPWSERGSQGERHEQAALLFNVIDAEKLIKAEDSKLEIKQHFALLPALDSTAKHDLGSDRLSLGEVLRHSTHGMDGLLSTDSCGIPVVAPRNLTDSGFDLTDLRYATERGRTTPRLRPGDVLMSRSRTMGAQPPSPLMVTVWRGELADATFSHTITRLVPDTERLLPDYLEAWLRHPQVRRQIESLPWPAEQELLNMDIDLPSLKEQVRMAHKIGKLAEERADRRIQLAKVSLIRSALTLALVGGDNVSDA